MLDKIMINNGTTDEILLDFSKKVSKLTNNNIILFSNHFLDHLYTIAHHDPKIVRSSFYVGIPNNLDGLINAEINFENGVKLKFAIKELYKYVFMLTYLEFTSKELEQPYTYYSPETIDGIWNV